MADTVCTYRLPITNETGLLGTTIDEYLTANGLSSETTLNLRYVRSLIPPLFEASFEHDDWVSCVDIQSSFKGQERILSGSYDGLLRIWNKSGQVIATSTGANLGGHTSSIKAAKFVSPTQIASAGLDRTVRLWEYTENEDGFSGLLKPTLELYGHKGSIDSLAVHASSSRLLTASLDGTIGLWSTQKSNAPPASASLVSFGPSAKRRKLTTSTYSFQIEARVGRTVPSLHFVGH
jgi:ribosome biogenesis protein YTM1